MNAAAFQAIADPTRRHIIEELSRSGTATATSLAVDLDMSRQAVAKHLVLLADAGLAHPERVGRETRYRPDVGGLAVIVEWVAGIEAAWEDRLGALAGAVSRPPSENPRNRAN